MQIMIILHPIDNCINNVDDFECKKLNLEQNCQMPVKIIKYKTTPLLIGSSFERKLCEGKKIINEFTTLQIYDPF